MNGQEADPVGTALRWLSETARTFPGHQVPAGWFAAVLEALEDAVRPHQPKPLLDFPEVRLCALDAKEWPCPTYSQVRDTLEGLL